MSDESTAAAADTGEENTGSNEGAETGGTTPEEVAAVLKSSGMNLPAEPTAAADDAEEGDDPDTVTASDAAEEDAAGEGKAAEEVANEEPVKPAPAPETKAPEATSEFTLEVEDAEGVTHKIEKIEDLPEDFEPKNNRQIMEVIKNLSDLESKKAAHEADEAKAAAEAETAKSVEAIQEGWQQEFKDLDVNEEGRREEIMKYMAQENDKRQADGKPLIRTVEHALLGLEKQEAKAAEEKAAKDAKDTARKNGGLVGGGSAPATPASSVYRAGSARNVNEAIRSAGLL
jgi:hypothetical protein